MKILKIIGAIIVLVIVVALVMALTGPSEGSIDSSIVIDASPEMVYEEAVNMEKLNAWSPWYTAEPDAYTYEGPESGVGAITKWESENPELGKGQITITEVVPNELVRTKMEFEGFNGDFSSWVKLSPEGEGSTKVVWGYDFKNLDLVGRFFMSMMDINEEMTPKFEEGLASLKQMVESKPMPEPEMDESMESDSTMMDSTAVEE